MNPSQPSGIITESDLTAVQPSQPVARKTKDFVTRLLPESEPVSSDGLPRDPTAGAHGAPNTAPAWATTPTLADLGVLYGGRDRLLTVGEAAEYLGVCHAVVYRLCAGAELRHVRIVHSIRIRPADLAAFVAGAAERPE